jgi:hypothetical protein
MSAFWLRCDRCGQNYVGGVVGSTPWPTHVCPDGGRSISATFIEPPRDPHRRPEDPNACQETCG